MAHISPLTGQLVDKNPTHKLALSIERASFTLGNNENGDGVRKFRM